MEIGVVQVGEKWKEKKEEIHHYLVDSIKPAEDSSRQIKNFENTWKRKTQTINSAICNSDWEQWGPFLLGEKLLNSEFSRLFLNVDL